MHVCIIDACMYAKSAAIINAEGIHILIDLNGHTSGVSVYVCVHV